jgi:protein involved in polysaccharide export with SLBB domain
MREMLLIAGLLIIVIGPGCSGTLSRNKEGVASGPVFAELPNLKSGLVETEEFVMRPGDEIAITFMQPDGRELPFTSKIRDDGTVTLLLSNKVFIAAGKTAREFEKEVSNQYGPKLFPIAMTDPAPIEVIGEVKAPGRQPFTGVTTVLKAIASAGGFTEHASQRRVKLIRSDGTQLLVNCIRARREAQLDMPVFPNDRIFVPGRLW